MGGTYFQDMVISPEALSISHRPFFVWHEYHIFFWNSLCGNRGTPATFFAFLYYLPSNVVNAVILYCKMTNFGMPFQRNYWKPWVEVKCVFNKFLNQFHFIFRGKIWSQTQDICIFLLPKTIQINNAHIYTILSYTYYK